VGHFRPIYVYSGLSILTILAVLDLVHTPTTLSWIFLGLILMSWFTMGRFVHTPKLQFDEATLILNGAFGRQRVFRWADIESIGAVGLFSSRFVFKDRRSLRVDPLLYVRGDMFFANLVSAAKHGNPGVELDDLTVSRIARIELGR